MSQGSSNGVENRNDRSLDETRNHIECLLLSTREDTKKTWSTWVSDFLIDLCGCLLPGIVFLTALYVWTYNNFLLEFPENEELCCKIIDRGNITAAAVMDMVSSIDHINMFSMFFFLCIAYIAGFLFYRRDVVLPDSVSQLIKIGTSKCHWPIIIYFKYVIVFCVLPFSKVVQWYQKHITKHCTAAKTSDTYGACETCGRCAYKTTHDEEWPKCAMAEQILYRPSDDVKRKNLPHDYVNRLRKYPYEDFSGYYLQKRGIDHLREYAKWDAAGDGTNSSSRTSKRSTEAYKAVLHYYAPSQCRDIDRLEAHVRLSSSLWYMSRMIGIMCICSLIWYACLVPCGVMRANPTIVWINIYMLAGVVTMSYFAAYFLHYLRRKEIFMILQTAYILGESRPEIKAVLLGLRAKEPVSQPE